MAGNSPQDATARARDIQLQELARSARSLAGLIDALFRPSIIALETVGWRSKDEMKAELLRMAACAERAMKEGGTFRVE